MPFKYNIDDLKKEFVNKTVNWLTVLDVFRDKNNVLICECICRCGNTIMVPLKTIRRDKVKSCGCFHKSKEYSDICKKWCKDNPDKVKARSAKFLQWVDSHKELIVANSKKHSDFLKNSSDIIEQNRKRMILLNKHYNKDNSTLKRIESIKHILDHTDISDKIHKDDLAKLLSGELSSIDKIRTMCPQCGEYSDHNVRDIFNLSKSEVKRLRFCKVCNSNYYSSLYEQDISNYIATFYNGILVRNTKHIIPPHELDLYYPEKKIAIEFNGDYWHSEKFKSKDYHYNKFKKCLESDILLVSIFESNWLLDRDNILAYLHDLFYNVENKLSMVADNIINNNYPTFSLSLDSLDFIEDFYMFKDMKVYTAGFSRRL